MGDVGIDMLAGPSEVLVLADETAVPAFVAIDLMAQAEHDPRAATYLVTTDPELPDLVEEALEILLEESPRGEITARSLDRQRRRDHCPDVVAALDTVRPHRARAPRGADGRPVRAARLDPKRGGDLPRSVDTRERGRLRCRAPTTCCPPAVPRASRARCRSTTS